MAAASHLRDLRNPDARFARTQGFSREFTLVAVLLALLAPATVRGDIYKWIDERGNTVLSNIKPADPDAVRNFQLAARETRVAAQGVAQAPAAAPRPAEAAKPAQAVEPTEQVLLERIETLERQVQAQQYVTQAQQYAALAQQYAVQAQVPMPSYPAYYPAPSPPIYYYPAPVAISYIAFPGRKFIPRTGFAHEPALVRNPAFLDRPPFGTRARIVNTGPVFVTPLRSSIAGGSLHRGRR